MLHWQASTYNPSTAHFGLLGVLLKPALAARKSPTVIPNMFLMVAPFARWLAQLS
jgi:hypothetical protein